jgi:uncharacterized protein
MRVAVTGASGLIGSALVPALRQRGHEVVPLVRRPASGPDEVTWDPAAGTIDAAALAGIDAAVHLAGEGIGDHRWSSEHKQRVLDSRVKGTTLLATTMAELDPKPAVLVSGSAVGFYGDRGDEVLTEESSAGTGFLADVVRQWEGSTAPAEAAGIRVVHLRTGIVLDGRGGALKRAVPIFKAGIGGNLGTGRQWWSWISIDDEVGLIVHGLENDAVRGPLNATAPAPVTNAEFSKALGRAVRRPVFMPVPNAALRVLYGKEMAAEMMLAGQRALPERAKGTGYTFRHPTIEQALEAALANR